MVLWTQSTMPRLTPATMLQPSASPTAVVRPMKAASPSGAPTRASRRTARKSFNDSSMPIENISRATPISAMTSKLWTSETAGPGVRGPTRIPAKT